MSELVVNLQDPESVSLARQILDMLDPTTSAANVSRNGGAVGGSASASVETTPPWEGPNTIDRSRGSAGRSESDSKPDDEDPWATSAPSPETPRAARSAPSTGNQAGTSTPADDDNPWS